ncbi:MAG: thioredoxin family protein [bacterium]|nr:MAG: thioredoxin family protein [bacterium]
MKIRQVLIGGQRIGIKNLDEIFRQVEATGIAGDENLKNEIFERVSECNYISPNMENIYKEDLFEEYRVFIGELAGRSRKKGIIEIRVYGPGCPRCEQLDRMTKEIIASKGISIDYLYVTNIQEMTAKGISVTPALTINEMIVLSGRVPTRQALEILLDDAISNM